MSQQILLITNIMVECWRDK